MTAAEQLAWTATVTPEEWCRRIRDGYRGKPYAFEKTNYFRALVELRKVGPSPPLPPTPAPGNQNLGLFAQPGVWCSWELLSLGYSATQIASEASVLGAKWVAMDSTINPVGDRNLAEFPAVASECWKRGITAGTWGEIHSGIAAASRAGSVAAKFHIVNREGLAQTEPTFLHDFRTTYPACDLAVVASPFDAFPHPDLDRHGWEVHVRDEGWLALPMLVEAYVDENPNATPLRLAAEASYRGFHPVAVVVESNKDHGWTLNGIDELDTKQRFGRALSLYLLGTARDEDKAKFRRMIS